MNRSVLNKVLTGFAVLAALVFEFFAVNVVFSSIDQGWAYGPLDLAWTGILLVSPLAVLSGLYFTRRSPLSGGALAAGAAVPMGALWFWFPPFWGLGLAVAAIAVMRARRFARQEQTVS